MRKFVVDLTNEDATCEKGSRGFKCLDLNFINLNDKTTSHNLTKILFRGLKQPYSKLRVLCCHQIIMIVSKHAHRFGVIFLLFFPYVILFFLTSKIFWNMHGDISWFSLDYFLPHNYCDWKKKSFFRYFTFLWIWSPICTFFNMWTFNHTNFVKQWRFIDVREEVNRAGTLLLFCHKNRTLPGRRVARLVYNKVGGSQQVPFWHPENFCIADVVQILYSIIRNPSICPTC